MHWVILLASSLIASLHSLKWNCSQSVYLFLFSRFKGDVRCVNILVSENLDLKLAGNNYTLTVTFIDFGVSLWIDSNNETKKKPFYRGDKGIYEFVLLLPLSCTID
jgi:hypothetical protein